MNYAVHSKPWQGLPKCPGTVRRLHRRPTKHTRSHPSLCAPHQQIDVRASYATAMTLLTGDWQHEPRVLLLIPGVITPLQVCAHGASRRASTGQWRTRVWVPSPPVSHVRASASV